MAIVAIANIRHGKTDGTVQEFKIGETVSGLTEDQVRDLVLGGSAVETGKNRKYSVVPVVGEQDEDTLKRDAIIAKAASEAVEDDETVTPASAPAAQLQSAAQGAPTAPGGPAAQTPQGTRAQQERAVAGAKPVKDDK